MKNTNGCEQTGRPTDQASPICPVDGTTKSVFSYSSKDLKFTNIKWPMNGHQFLKSEFDLLLDTAWNKAMQNGHFWYHLDEIEERKIPGKTGFVAQLNTKRFSQRRKPSELHNVRQPFSASGFNFTKVKEHEVLFKLMPAYESDKRDQHTHQIVINVSPIGYGHVLIVPSVTACHPQALTVDAVRIALEMCLLSCHRGLRIGFNSLCAFASVNHLHLHALYINHQLPLDRVKVSDCGYGLFELVDYIVRGFALQIGDENILKFAKKVGEITAFLYEEEIPHNLFICRNDHFAVRPSNEPKTQSGTVTVFIFPKYPAPGVKDTRALNSSCFDVAGYLLLKDVKDFQELTETRAITVLNNYTFHEDEFSSLKDKITLMLSKSFQK